MKRLVRVSDGRMVCGVCTGVAQYLGVDVTAVRVVWALLSISGGLGIFGYIVAAFLIPKEDNWIE